jgi:hypothetical protein
MNSSEAGKTLWNKHFEGFAADMCFILKFAGQEDLRLKEKSK